MLRQLLHVQLVIVAFVIRSINGLLQHGASVAFVHVTISAERVAGPVASSNVLENRRESVKRPSPDPTSSTPLQADCSSTGWLSSSPGSGIESSSSSWDTDSKSAPEAPPGTLFTLFDDRLPKSVGTSNPSCFSQAAPGGASNGLLDAFVAASIELHAALAPSVCVAGRPEDRALVEVIPPGLFSSATQDDVFDIGRRPTVTNC